MAECKECGKTMGFADVNAKSFDGNMCELHISS